MKELLESILNVEDEIEQKNSQVDKESQSIFEAARQKIDLMEKEFENGFIKDRDAKTEAVHQASSKYDAELKSKVRKEIGEKEAAVTAKKEMIKKKIVDILLG